MYRTSNFNKNSKIMHSIEKIISILIYIIIIPIIIFNLTMMIKSYINPTEIPDFFGLKSFVIVSESMESTIMKGDAIFIKKVNQDELKRQRAYNLWKNRRGISIQNIWIWKNSRTIKR